ncbi:MAG: MFS transporter [Candidatus Peribacteraceae bacterium]|nr:MFS transporter [Candidatus Peribacteraceae bacterium]
MASPENIFLAKRNVHLQAWVNFCTGLTFLIPVITLFYTARGLSLFQIVIVANVASAAVWLFDIPTSIFADTVGRTKALRWSVVSNFVCALAILVFPQFIGFLVASFFSGLYMSFWSGTGQSFLAENLAVLEKPEAFGRFMGRFMFAEQLALFGTPFVASGVLFLLPIGGYRVLAALDVLSAFALLILAFQLREIAPAPPRQSLGSLISANLATAREAFSSVFKSARLRLLLIYRSLANHVAYLPLVILPVLVKDGMVSWVGGIIVALSSLASMLASRYAYVLGERRSYNTAWMLATVLQGALLIVAGLILSHWLLLAALFVVFNFLEGLWQPAWNHVLVEESHGKAVATTRSIVFSFFALYTTLGKQILAFLSLPVALVGLGTFILLVNLILGPSLLNLHSTKKVSAQPLAAV